MSRRLSRSEADALVKGLQALSKAQGLYPPGHTAVARAREALDGALAGVLAARKALVFGLADGYLVVGDVLFVDGGPHAAELAARLEARGIEGVVADRGTTAEDLGLFLEWLRAPQPEPWSHPKIVLTSLERSGAHWEKALKLHGAALQALQEADRDIREGRLPDPGRARECVTAFTELLEEKPSLLPGLLLIKDYDNYTFYHSVNVSLLSLGIGRQLGLSPAELEELGLGGLLHDIGKTKTPVELLRKPGRLTAEEMEVIRRHPVHGRDILLQLGEVPESAVRVVHEHHVGYDGNGYPARETVPGALHRLTPLVTTADVYDAMTTHRPYQKPATPPAAVATMEGLRGAYLAPEVFDAFLALMGKVPVGTLLRLRSGEVGVATRVATDGSPAELWMVAGPDGRDLPEPERFAREIEAYEVAGWVGALSRRVDPFEAVKART